MEMLSDDNIMENMESKGQKFIEKGSYVKKRTAIIKAEPFVAVLSSKFRDERCDTCFRSCKVSRCSGCQYVYYCGRNCQRKSWSVHKVECSNLKRVLSMHPLPNAARMMAHIIIKLQHGGDQERGYYGPNESRTFGDLMSHTCDIVKDSKTLEHFTALYVVLHDFLPQDILPNRHELLTIYGRMIINSFEVCNGSFESIGSGIYLGPSIINHSCKPNASSVFDGTTLTIYAVRDIPSFDWTKVSLSYIDVMQSVDERREELLKYYFWCNCDGCANPDPVETAAACPNKSCTNPCFPEDHECSKCGQKFPFDFEDNFEMIKSRSRHYLEQPTDERKLESIRACLAEQEDLLHPLNMLYVHMLQIAMATANDSQVWNEAETYSAKLLQKFEYYCGNSHPLTGHAYMTYALILFCNGKSKKASDIIKKNIDIIKTLGGLRALTDRGIDFDWNND